jgi:hypothetical protein
VCHPVGEDFARKFNSAGRRAGPHAGAVAIPAGRKSFGGKNCRHATAGMQLPQVAAAPSRSNPADKKRPGPIRSGSLMLDDGQAIKPDQ